MKYVILLCVLPIVIAFSQFIIVKKRKQVLNDAFERSSRDKM